MASPRLVTGANRRVSSAWVSPLDGLGPERAAVRASHQRNPLGGLPPLRARGCSATRVAEPDECVAAEVRDEEREFAGTERAGEALSQDIDSGDGRSVLDGREQRAEIQPRR
jgi:hypothetical protein